MKGVVVEIHKKHFVVMTKDGQFIIHNGPAGSYEIGDEIFISPAHAYESDLKTSGIIFLFKNASPAKILSRAGVIFAAVCVIAGFSYAGVKFIGSEQDPFSRVAAASEEKAEQQGSTTESLAADETTGEEQTFRAAEASPEEDEGEVGSESVPVEEQTLALEDTSQDLSAAAEVPAESTAESPEFIDAGSGTEVDLTSIKYTIDSGLDANIYIVNDFLDIFYSTKFLGQSTSTDESSGGYKKQLVFSFFNKQEETFIGIARILFFNDGISEPASDQQVNLDDFKSAENLEKIFFLKDEESLKFILSGVFQ